MEFLRSAKRRSLVSEAIYLLLNIGLAATILIVVWVVESPLPAFALVLLSKWRVLAVRPRYWIAHIQANMVDLVVSLGIVTLLYSAGHAADGSGMIVQILLTLLYIAWLLVLKPRTKRKYVVAQAGVALLIGTIALYSSSYGWASSIVVLGMFVLGYSTARHVLSAYSDSDLTLMSIVWGFVFAQLGWLAYHWTIAYSVPFVSAVKIPQVTIVALALSFIAERVYASYTKHGSVKSSDVFMPILFSLAIVVVVLTLFNGVSSGNI